LVVPVALLDGGDISATGSFYLKGSTVEETRADNTQERLVSDFARLQVQGSKKIGSRRLAHTAQVSEHRAFLFLREQAASARV
jgi:hypothetical protein